MIGELVVIAVVVVVPAMVVLGLLALITLAMAGLIVDPVERRLVRR